MFGKYYLMCVIVPVSVGASTDAEHMRLDLALDEAVDLKRSATGTCYSREFVRFQSFVVDQWISLLAKTANYLSIVHDFSETTVQLFQQAAT